MAKRKLFITGTDTDVGKTVVACALLHTANTNGLTTAAIKPVAAGCEITEQGLRNGDALALMEAMSIQLPYAQINPVALADPIAPHIAAQREGKRLTVDRLNGFCNGILMQPADMVLVEGAGGWQVPLNPRETLADLAISLQLDVVLVVGMKLGCINHATLTAEAIQRDGLKLVGWVANCIDPDMSCQQENLAALTTLLPAPCLGVIPHLVPVDAESASAYLELNKML